VRGVAALATPADFDDWGRHPRRLLLHARQVQVIKDPDFPPAFDQWAAAIKSVRPVAAAERLAPRPLLLVHGDSDDLTPPADGRALAGAHGSAEFRLINGAGHELRHDPRAVAVLLGWLARQQIDAAVAEGRQRLTE
jgi:putative redox protein